MAVFACLSLLVAYSVALSTTNISSAHVVDQESSGTDLPLIQPPTNTPSIRQLNNEVSVKGQPTATELLSRNSPCGLGQQYWGPPGAVGAPGEFRFYLTCIL